MTKLIFGCGYLWRARGQLMAKSGAQVIVVDAEPGARPRDFSRGDGIKRLSPM